MDSGAGGDLVFWGVVGVFGAGLKCGFVNGMDFGDFGGFGGGWLVMISDGCENGSRWWRKWKKSRGCLFFFRP